jgi:hypothetical protein
MSHYNDQSDPRHILTQDLMWDRYVSQGSSAMSLQSTEIVVTVCSNQLASEQ